MSGCPPCMDAREWELWLAAAADTSLRQAGPCWDCTPEFAAAMRAVGRCDSEPTEEPETPLRHSLGGRPPRAETLRRQAEADELFHERHWSYSMIARHLCVSRRTAGRLVRREDAGRAA